MLSLLFYISVVIKHDEISPFLSLNTNPVSDIVAQIQENVVQETHSETEDEFSKETKAIIQDLEKYGFELFHRGGTALQEYKKKCGCFHDRLNESILLINAFTDEATNTRKEKILQTAQKACAMIKENNDEFYGFQENWNIMNDCMKRTNTSLNSLSEKGIIVYNVIPSSLYLLLEAESVQKLDNFWQEYTEGCLSKEFQQKLFSGRRSDLTVHITEENYTQYRKYLGMYREIFFSVLNINIDNLRL